jgi:hypothetical protein
MHKCQTRQEHKWLKEVAMDKSAKPKINNRMMEFKSLKRNSREKNCQREQRIDEN